MWSTQIQVNELLIVEFFVSSFRSICHECSFIWGGKLNLSEMAFGFCVKNRNRAKVSNRPE